MKFFRKVVIIISLSISSLAQAEQMNLAEFCKSIGQFAYMVADDYSNKGIPPSEVFKLLILARPNKNIPEPLEPYLKILIKNIYTQPQYSNPGTAARDAYEICTLTEGFTQPRKNP
jgi:hypothetical protein